MDLSNKNVKVSGKDGQTFIYDKETFFKYINMIPTYLDGRGYLIKDPKELVGKNGQD